MLIGSLPFRVNSNESEIINQILNEPTTYPLNSWKKISFSGKEFVMGLLQKDFTKRLTIKQALDHDWLNIKLEKQKSINFSGTEAKSFFAKYCNVDVNI